MNFHPFQARPALANVNSDETLFYSLNVSVNKCGGNCNTNSDQYASACVPNKVKDMNEKYLM